MTAAVASAARARGRQGGRACASLRYPELGMVADGDYAGASASLGAMRDAEVVQLNARLRAMTKALQPVNAVLPAIR